jgi:hypothetical protein
MGWLKNCHLKDTMEVDMAFKTVLHGILSGNLQNVSTEPHTDTENVKI